MRRAFLCGNGKEHSKAWVEERLQNLARCFAVDVAGYAVMTNHLHVVLRLRPAATTSWDALEVMRRWMSVYPRQYLADGSPVLPSDQAIAMQAVNPTWVEERRRRLADVGWFMKALKEAISRRANREDQCSGAFWEGRFTSIPLLDQPALIACMAYVDLNPVRAKLAETPERSEHTGGRQRIRARQRHRTATRLRERDPQRAEKLLAKVGLDRHATHAEDGLWLCPLARCIVGKPLANRMFTTDDYLTILDATGKVLRAGKRGAIDPRLAPILARLDLRVEDWISTMLGRRQMEASSGVGAPAARQASAQARGLAWVRNRCPLFARAGERAA